MKKITLLIFILSLLLLLSCGDKNGVVTLESGLQFVEDSVGTGREAKKDDLCTFHFAGWIITDSTNLYSDWRIDPTKAQFTIGDSKQRNQPIKIVLGTSSFIKGSDEGIYGMKVGGKRSIIIPSKLAYGEKGIGPIPPNTDLKLSVELLELKDRIKVEQWEVPESSYKTTESGLKYAIINEGEGSYADSGNAVTVFYNGFIKDGPMFDSAFERDEPFTFVLGMGQVMKGWEEGMKLMKKGSKVKLIIPPDMGYGGLELEKIPANSTLVFDIELIEIQ